MKDFIGISLVVTVLAAIIIWIRLYMIHKYIKRSNSEKEEDYIRFRNNMIVLFIILGVNLLLSGIIIIFYR